MRFVQIEVADFKANFIKIFKKEITEFEAHDERGPVQSPVRPIERI